MKLENRRLIFTKQFPNKNKSEKYKRYAFMCSSQADDPAELKTSFDIQEIQLNSLRESLSKATKAARQQCSETRVSSTEGESYM